MRSSRARSLRDRRSPSRAAIGPPRGECSQASPGRYRYCSSGEHDWTYEHTGERDLLTFDVDSSSGIVSRIHILYPPRH